MAKRLASEVSWAAANVCLDTHGGYGFVAIKVLGLPRSY